MLSLGSFIFHSHFSNRMNSNKFILDLLFFLCFKLYLCAYFNKADNVVKNIWNRLKKARKIWHYDYNCFWKRDCVLGSITIQFVDNKAKGRISKRVFQGNKARQIFRKNNYVSPLDRNTRTCKNQGVRKYSFFGKFGVLCFLVIPVLRFVLLPYYQQILTFFWYFPISYDLNSTLFGKSCDNSYSMFVITDIKYPFTYGKSNFSEMMHISKALCQKSS